MDFAEATVLFLIGVCELAFLGLVVSAGWWICGWALAALRMANL